MARKRHGRSYAKRVAEINQIYDLHAKSGLPNREIWRRYIYPVYGICERSFYRMLKCPVPDRTEMVQQGFLFPDLFEQASDERRRPDYFKKSPE